METSIKKIITYILLVIVIGVCVYLGYAFGKKIPPFGSTEKYQIVQFSSGEVYYGKLQMFPCCKLSDVYFIKQVPATEEGEESSTQLLPFTSMFFEPKNAIYFDRSQIIWWANLSPDSQVIKSIKGLREGTQQTPENQQNTQTQTQTTP
ncbi:MAG TPA: hypothetical protein PLL80_01205 [Candidatus Pacearchaeota archaeon]|nr:hypothetical protein [Candidatus Pacearchaeota archaeon]HOK94145.1 hypothetical protein [Candidatus Pacearchaeota archaeon]HPO75215.1 hypothetical protein [Candidatus Pacearchaeota archaeon]